MVWLILLMLMFSPLVYLIHKTRGSAEARKATEYHCELQKQFWQMYDNPSTTKADWQAMMPAAKKSDEWWARTHPQSPPGTMSLQSWVNAFAE